jgi:uncharacterized membrane protein
MMGALYQILFTGQLKPGIDPEEALQEFATVFKVPDDKARQLVLGGQERVLKKEVDEANAERYRALLDDLGLVVRVEPIGAEWGSGPTGQDRPAAGTGPHTQPNAGPNAAAGGAHAASASKTEGVDPYAPPAADLSTPRGVPLEKMMTGPHAVPAGHGWQWITSGFDLFKRLPAVWIGAVVLLMLINLVVSLVPMLGGLLGTLLGPVFLGGLMLGAHAQASGGRLQIADLFAGFSANPSRLFAVGGLYLGGIMSIVVIVLMVVSIFGVGIGTLDPAVLEQQDPELVAATLGPMFLLALLFLMFLLIPLIMAYWFAPVLVVLEDMQALEAMKLSFTACWRNVVPFMVFGLAAFVLLILGAIPFGLGLFIVSPVLVASIYTSYRDIFYRQ